MASLIDQLESMRQLTEGWDGYGAARPRADLIDLAQEFVHLLLTLRPGETENSAHVSPTRNGGVLLEWENSARQHEVEISPDGSIGFLHVDKASQAVESRRFEPGRPSILAAGLLQEIRQLVAA